VNIEQASKREMWEPSPLRLGEGRRPLVGRARDRGYRSDRAVKKAREEPTGVVVMACLPRRTVGTREIGHHGQAQARVQRTTREGEVL